MCGVVAEQPIWKQCGSSYEYYAENQPNPLNPTQNVGWTALSPLVYGPSGNTVRIGAPYSALNSPSKKALLGDVWFWHLGDQTPPNGQVAARNTLYVDGHAARVRGLAHLEARAVTLTPWHSFVEVNTASVGP